MIQFIGSCRIPKTKAEPDKPVMSHAAKNKTHFLGETCTEMHSGQEKLHLFWKRVLIEISNLHDPQYYLWLKDSFWMTM